MVLDEPQVTFHFATHEIVVCALVQMSGIGAMAEGTLLVPVILWHGEFGGLQHGMERQFHA